MQNKKIKSTGYDKVRNTQISLFKDSGIDKNDFKRLIHLLAPEMLADYLGLEYHEVEKIPTNDCTMEVAGLLDRENKTIYVSKEFPAEQRRLTGMHELVHWMLHENSGLDLMHRDRPISYLPKEGSVDRIEWEATNVACQYLMPKKMVKRKFSEIFDLPREKPLVFDENVAFFLNENIEKLRGMDRLQRARRLATAQYYGSHIISLHQQFKVSPTAMAIRLLELELIAPDRQRGRPDLHIV